MSPRHLALLMLPLALLFTWQPELNTQAFLWAHTVSRGLPAGLWRVLTLFGDWITVVALLFPIAYHHRERLLPLVFGSTGVILLTVLLKALWAEPRPPLVLGPLVQLLDRLPGNASFPSGHAMAVSYLAGWYASAFFLPLWARLGLCLLMMAVAWSRLAIGVHWPVDVCVGLAAGAWIGHWAALQAWPLRFDLWRRLLGLLVLVLVVAGCVHLSWLWQTAHAADFVRFGLILTLGLATGWGVYRTPAMKSPPR